MLFFIAIIETKTSKITYPAFSSLTHPDFSKLPCSQFLHHLNGFLGNLPGIFVPRLLGLWFHTRPVQVPTKSICFICRGQHSTQASLSRWIHKYSKYTEKILKICHNLHQRSCWALQPVWDPLTTGNSHWNRILKMDWLAGLDLPDFRLVSNICLVSKATIDGCWLKDHSIWV